MISFRYKTRFTPGEQNIKYDL